MSCRLEEQVLRFGTKSFTRAHAALLAEHARACPTCKEALRLISSTAAALKSAPIEAQPGEAQRVEQALVAWHHRRARSRPMRLVLAFAAAGAAAGMIAMVLAKTAPTAPAPLLIERPAVQEARLDETDIKEPEGTQLPEHRAVQIAAKSKLRAGRARVVTGSDAKLSFEPGDALSELALEDGHIAVAFEDTHERFVVSTPEARIETLGATFQVKSTAGGTAVYVDRGAVEVTEPHRPRVQLRAGQKISIPHTRMRQEAPPPKARVEPAVDPIPDPAPDPMALMNKADAERRRGELETALADYLRAADQPRAASYIEEALLRAARIEVTLGRADRAESVLARADRVAPRGPLLPERMALAASIARARGRTMEAARILESLPASARSLSLAEERLATARVLLESDPARARTLVDPLVEVGPGASIKERAKTLRDAIDARK